MPLRVGNNADTPSQLYVGNQAVNRVYQGDNLVWEAASPPPAGDYSLTFTAERSPVNVWPETLWVRANVVGPDVPDPQTNYDPQTHQWAYYWTSMDINASFTYFSSSMPHQSSNQDSMIGRIAAHSPSEPGTYNWQCTAVNLSDWTKVATGSYTFTVNHPDTVFTADETLVVSNQGGETWAGAPDHNPANRYTTINAAWSSVGSRTGRVRILVKRGQTHNLSEGGVWGAGITHAVVGTWGTGSRPTLNLTSGGSVLAFNTDKILQCHDLIIDGLGNLTSSPWSEGGQWFLNVDVCNLYLTFRGCLFRNCGLAVQVQGASGRHLSFVDCEWDGFGLAASLTTGRSTNSYLCYRGVRVNQNVNALAKPSAADFPSFNGGFGNRDEGFMTAVYDTFHGFNRTGWFENIPDRSTTQPVVRSGCPTGGYVAISRSVFEKGAFSIGRTNDPATVGNVVIENCQLVGAQANTNVVGISLRNCIFEEEPNQVTLNQVSWAFQIPGSGSAAVLAAPNLLLNNTVTSMKNTLANTNWGPYSTQLYNSGNGLNVTELNTARYYPLLPSPQNDGPFNLARQTTPLYSGYFDGNNIPAAAIFIINRSGTWSIGNTINGVAISGLYGDIVTLVTEPGTTIPPGTVTNSVGGTGTVIYASHNYRAGTAYPHWRLDFTDLTASFYVGGTLTNGSATAQIRQVFYDGSNGTLWLGPVSGGSFSNADTLTDNRGGLATANGDQSNATGLYASWQPLAGSLVIGSATAGARPPRDFYNVVRPGSPSRGAVEA